VTEKEVAEMKKKMAKGKAAGIDGLPIEFWQTVEFTDTWLQQVFNETRKRKKMTWTMRMAVVKIIYKKGERNKMSNYRPISILCADYKLLAKIVTNRMRPVLNSVIQNDQQGFIQEGDITGNLILVKEIIQYCNEEGIEGSLILMDFKKAYDRVDRGLMIKTLEAMNFGPDFIQLIQTLYEDVMAVIEVNDELTGEIGTGGGVRQGCPLSPFLFICILELMAIAVRENTEVQGIVLVEPVTGKEDKISLFADDSAICLGKPHEQAKEARITMKRYEEASGSELHDGKTMIMKIGSTRKRVMTNMQIEVKFTILEDEAKEKYLGDVVGNEVTEKERFEDRIEKMKKIGNRWNRENVTVYGRALVSNTLIMPVILYRARVNAITRTLEKEIQKTVKDFIWRKVPSLKWSIAVRGIQEGGIGVKDPICMIDSTRIKMIKDMREKKAQPWVKWMERKEHKLKKKWNVKSVFHGKIKKAQIKELKETCLFESAVRVWHELKGKTEEKNGKEEMMMKIGEEWKELKKIRGKETYNQLVRMRYGELKEEEKERTNHAMSTIARKLTPQQRQFWWRVAHKKYMTNNKAHKWKLDRRGRAPSECNVCRDEIETWDHMEYDCDGVKKWMERLRGVYENYTDMKNGDWTVPTRDEWRLKEKVKMKDDVMMVIALARWMYHKERSSLVHRQRRRMDLDRLAEQLEEELNLIKEKDKERERKKKEEGEGEKGKGKEEGEGGGEEGKEEGKEEEEEE
jgi:hypothetical protein